MRAQHHRRVLSSRCYSAVQRSIFTWCRVYKYTEIARKQKNASLLRLTRARVAWRLKFRGNASDCISSTERGWIAALPSPLFSRALWGARHSSPPTDGGLPLLLLLLYWSLSHPRFSLALSLSLGFSSAHFSLSALANCSSPEPVPLALSSTCANRASLKRQWKERGMRFFTLTHV